MKLLLVDVNPAICVAWRNLFDEDPDVDVACSRFEDVTRHLDVFVTPGNSFGLMDGGIDLAVARLWPGVEHSVQEAIAEMWQGELPVGSAVRVHAAFGIDLVYAPTMPIPMPIARTENVYLATRAALRLIQPYERVGICGLGGLSGRVPPNVLATQMRWAWQRHHGNGPTARDGWQAIADYYRSQTTVSRRDAGRPWATEAE